MSFGNRLIDRASSHIGQEYKLGARAKYLDPNFAGPWDCAEFVSWVVFQESGEQELLGCQPRNPASADAYTGQWVADAKKYGLIISVEEALSTVGTALLRSPNGHPHGHIAFSVGDGQHTVEAMDSKHGVTKGPANPQQRGWDYGVRIPDPAQWAALTRDGSKPAAWFFRPDQSSRGDPRIVAIQNALSKAAGTEISATGIYSTSLARAVGKFQKANDIVVDGFVGSQTLAVLTLKLEATIL